MRMITGVIQQDRRTKALVNRLRPGAIALICHPDLDEVAADGLRRGRARAVLNGAPSISGRYPNLGPSLLLAAGIPLVDIPPAVADRLRDGDVVGIDPEGRVWQAEKMVGAGVLMDRGTVGRLLEQARANLPVEIARFIDNTLLHAHREKHLFMTPWPVPPLRTTVAGRPALVVVRGHRHREDLAALRPFIAEMDPVLIGVDGGADALLEAGHCPHLIVGDMDSVTDDALRAGTDVIVHAYIDGGAPGMARIRRLGVPAHVLPLPGTSEDVALLLAYEAGASLIVAVGAHSNLIDFLEKGRSGMASTFLVRMKVGFRLIDARGVSMLYRARPRPAYPLQIALAAMIPVLLAVLLGQPVRQLLRLTWLQLRMLAGW